MNHHTAMWQCRTLTFRACHQQNGGHRSSHTRTDGSDIAGDELHGIVDAQSCRHATAWRIQVDADILTGIDGVEIQQLSLQRIGCIVINLCTEEDVNSAVVTAELGRSSVCHPS